MNIISCIILLVKREGVMSETLDFAIANLTSAPVLAFIMGLIVVAIRSPLTVPPQIFEFLYISASSNWYQRRGLPNRGAS